MISNKMLHDIIILNIVPFQKKFTAWNHLTKHSGLNAMIPYSKSKMAYERC